MKPPKPGSSLAWIAGAILLLGALPGCGSAHPSSGPPPAATTPPPPPASAVEPAGGGARTAAPPSGAPPTSMVDLGPGADGRPRSVPAVLRLRMHLPGPAPDRYLVATLRIGLGTESTLVGCVAGVDGACEETQREVLTAADHEAYLRAWSEVAAMPPCEPLARFPGDRLFTLEAAGTRYEDPLPADPAQLEARTRETCAAPARLAVWIARRMRAIP